jgi:hypothetical protein
MRRNHHYHDRVNRVLDHISEHLDGELTLTRLSEIGCFSPFHFQQHYTIFYVEVDDVQAYLDKAASLGGKTIVPPVKIPTGTFAWFSDLDGNTVGLLKRR